MEKQTYITPKTEVMNLETIEMMATSTEIEILKGERGDQQLSNERRGGWGDLWE